MTKATTQVTNPLHIENTVNSLAAYELQLPRAFKTYRSMMSDEFIGAGISLIQSMINKLDYRLIADKDATQEEKKLVLKLNKSLDNLNGYNKVEFLNLVLSMLYYGHSMFEMVFKRDTGSMVYDTFSPIHPIDVLRYEYKRNNLDRLILTPADNDGLIVNNDVAEKVLKGSKVMMFKLNSDLDYPLGRSLLNRCYEPWKKKQIVGEYEIIGVAKNLSGVMKITAPSSYINDYYNNPASDNAIYIDDMLNNAANLHAGKASFALVPSDSTDQGVKQFDITTIGNSGATDTDTVAIMNRFDQAILTTLYTDILSLGQAGGGSFALGDSKTNLLALFIDSILKTISSAFGKAVKQAYELNGIKPKGNYASLHFDAVENIDFEAFTRGWQRLVQAQIITADDELEDFFREKLKAPERDKTAQGREVKNDPSVNDQNERDEKEK